MVYCNGHIVSQETRRKISAANKGHICSEEHKAKLSKALKGHMPWNKGIPHSEETCRRISEGRKGIPVSEKTRKTLSHPHTKEHNLKISLSVKNSPLAKANREYLAKKHLGQHLSEETKNKIAEALKHPLLPNKKGRNHFNWKGGVRLSNIRQRSTRRELGFICLNEWEENTLGFSGHHLDKDHVIYIPRNLHESIRHRQKNQESMSRINEIVIDWYINYYGLI